MTARGEDSAGAGKIHLSDPSPKFPPGATLTPITTLSSPWKMGMNLSPRRISAWFRGRNRQSTLMLHSLLVSAMVVAGDGLGTSRAAGTGVRSGGGVLSRGRGGGQVLGLWSRESRWGARARAGERGRDALLAPAARGCGRPGRLVLSRRSASPPLALQRRAAGLGGAAAAGRAGLPSRGGLPLGFHPLGHLSVSLASSPDAPS